MVFPFSSHQRNFSKSRKKKIRRKDSKEDLKFCARKFEDIIKGKMISGVCLKVVEIEIWIVYYYIIMPYLHFVA